MQLPIWPRQMFSSVSSSIPFFRRKCRRKKRNLSIDNGEPTGGDNVAEDEAPTVIHVISKFYLTLIFFVVLLFSFGDVYSSSTSTSIPNSSSVSSTKCGEIKCYNGECLNGTCSCFDGWRGPSCQFCTGKVKLSGTSGYIHDGVGNYSIDVKCSWLIDGSAIPNASIRLHIEEFATECGWDHLYIYNGDSVHSPLLAVYSGLMYKGDYSIRRVPEIVAQSGYALIHFYSDVAYNMSGFNISYRLNSCPSQVSSLNCSGHGVCIDGVCTCDAFYTGEACDTPICPNNCSYSNGLCIGDRHRCECNPKYKGEDCSQVASLGYWEVVRPRGSLPKGSASHSAVVWRDSLHIIGGESYNTSDMIYTYDFNGNVWETNHMDSKTAPTPRYGHSAVIFGDKIYIYGGVKSGGSVCNELWAFDVSAKSWENITVRAEPCNMTSLCGPLKSAGHTATLVPSKRSVESLMIVIFGHSPIYGYLNTVQEYRFGKREWSIVKTKGFPVKAGYGHSSAWDPLTERIYVYGGYISETPATPLLSNRLYAYDPDTRTWTLLSSGPSARFLHTGTFLNGLMIVFGGNTHNDTTQSQGAKCYSSDALAYDVVCDSWSYLNVPSALRADLPRFGHSAVTFSNSLYIYGGFDGQMLNDLLKYTGGVCDSLPSITACLNTRPGTKCVWDRKELKCKSILDIDREYVINPDADVDEEYYLRCPKGSRSSVTANIVACNQLQDCISCVHTSLGCGWCPLSNKCTHENICKYQTPDSQIFNPVRAVTISTDCPTEEGSNCQAQHSCLTCTVHSDCHWTGGDHCTANSTLDSSSEVIHGSCGPSCSQLTSCLNCTQLECIWCHNEQRCVDKTAYTASFPYGQCREWSTQRARCPLTPGESACMSHKWCSECRDAPECGWCDDGTGTGKGVCLPGGNNSPDQCAKKHWYFTDCPSCQCNGHSTCAANSSVCIQPCANLTQGEHCETCIPGYYGSPVNGGTCTPCECNNHGTQCVPDTGKCHCTTKGIMGDHCERCDTQNHYLGDPTNDGSCFYDLTIDYQFTFNLSKKDDRHYTQINFKNSPTKADIDADFSITCSVTAKMNITIKTVNQPEKPLFTGHNCSNFKSRFYKNEHNFGVLDNVTFTTFYVYVYDFQPPLWIQISFSQYPKLNLQQFFITFSSCFLLLLLVAAILWKIKQKYDMFRRRQRLFVEMEQMASRPFSQVLVEIEKRQTTTDNTPTSPTSKKKECPSPIALEPCSGNRAAVLSLLVRLPTGGSPYTPHGQSAGLAIASALVTLGNPRKVSIDTVKGDVKGKSRKTVSSQHPDSCI